LGPGDDTKMIASWRLAIAVILTTAFFISTGAVHAETEPSASTEISSENINPETAGSVLAKLSDEQVRVLLLKKFQEETATQLPAGNSSSGFLALVIKWLHLIDTGNKEEPESGLKKIIRNARSLPTDLAITFDQFGTGSDRSSFGVNSAMMVLVLLVALFAEKVYQRAIAHFDQQVDGQSVSRLGGGARFGAACLRALASLTSLTVFGGSALLIFVLSPLSETELFRLLFMAVLFIILYVRVVIVLTEIVCAPDQPSFRLLNIDDTASLNLQRVIRISLIFAGGGLAFIALIKEIGIPRESGILLATTLGTLFILLLSYFVVRNRQVVADAIRSGTSTEEEGGWFVRQFSALWHILAILYLVVVWLNFVYAADVGAGHDKGAFLYSLLAVPFFLLFDHIGQWVVQATVAALRLNSDIGKQEQTAASDAKANSPIKQEKLLLIRLGRVVRFAILCAVAVWVLNLWDYQIPYAKEVARAVFESLVTLALALLFWRTASAYIERKIAEFTPDVKEKETDDGEWGAAAQRGRSYTLLPMVRKFIGTVLTVMVTLIILSSIGVNIGPLLAGAGVVGLAVGFGAQKLVSDVLSGFFYLLDDAFRVGEYVQAGSISGTVENITLRNIMLRHHRGMLQIVPYSELGSITNFMRGGIVVKFNLEFPYNTDIDKVRKVIKKVGQTMWEEEEYRDDFIKPIKSQGVREITNSVMVIRIKFTAKPGAHFLIRREAYKRITEALMAIGIHYAHRKVIVELPETVGAQSSESQKLAEVGAAAALTTLAEEEKKQVESKDSSPDIL